jgi:hypothetical protein
MGTNAKQFSQLCEAKINSSALAPVQLEDIGQATPRHRSVSFNPVQPR